MSPIKSTPPDTAYSTLPAAPGAPKTRTGVSFTCNPEAKIAETTEVVNGQTGTSRWTFQDGTDSCLLTGLEGNVESDGVLCGIGGSAEYGPNLRLEERQGGSLTTRQSFDDALRPCTGDNEKICSEQIELLLMAIDAGSLECDKAAILAEGTLASVCEPVVVNEQDSPHPNGLYAHRPMGEGDLTLNFESGASVTCRYLPYVLETNILEIAQ